MRKTVSLSRQGKAPLMRVYLQPLNENQELNYSESFIGTASEIVQKSRRIIRDLSKVLSQGTFTIKIEDLHLTDSVIITDKAILDGDYQPITNFEEALS